MRLPHSLRGYIFRITFSLRDWKHQQNGCGSFCCCTYVLPIPLEWKCSSIFQLFCRFLVLYPFSSFPLSLDGMSSSSVPSSASSGSPSAFPSSSDRFSPITQYDHAGYLWITTLLTTTYAILSILVRWYIKRRCFGIDDSTCVAATVSTHTTPKSAFLSDYQLLGIGAFIATFVALNQGLGKAVPALDDIQLQDIGEVRSIELFRAKQSKSTNLGTGAVCIC